MSVRPANGSESWAAEHNEAVRIARQGNTSDALIILDRLRRSHPEDQTLTRDQIVILDWAGQEEAALALFQELPHEPQPAFIMAAAGHAYLALNQPDKALALYRQGLSTDPANAELASGEIRGLVDIDKPDLAIARAETDLHAHGDRIEPLLAAGYAARAQKQPIETVRYDDRALVLDPRNRPARHDRILAFEAMGAPQLARQEADNFPGSITAEEYRHIQGSEAAALVRWGVLEPANEAERFVATDRAIAALDALILAWQPNRPASAPDILRARFDRIVALHDRVRMSDVLTDYDDLQKSGVVLPNYALVAVADAYVYLRQPKAARVLYQHILETEPANPELRLAQVNADVDLDDFDAAYQHADEADKIAPRWHYLKGLGAPVPNPVREIADLSAASVRLFADDLAEAGSRFTMLAEVAPDNAEFRAGLGNLDRARGWPRRAAEEYDIGLARIHPNLALEIGQARNNFDLHEYRAVDTELNDLKTRFPENLEVQRVDREWQVYNMAEFRVEAEQAFRSATNVQGGAGLSIATQLYSPPIDYDWRVFVGDALINEQLPQGEGRLVFNSPSIGAEYRGRDLAASFEGDLNTYRAQDETGENHGEHHLGGRATVLWSIDDYWQVGGVGEIFSRDTPTRALRSGVTADGGNAALTWRQSESREAAINAEALTFSDGNLRSSFAARYSERILIQPHFTIDAIASLAESQNSKDRNRPYFNPAQDALTTIGADISQILYRRYEFIYDHRLIITPGVYWQSGFGEATVVSIRYDQRLRVNDVFDAMLGVGFGRQPYDGVYENAVSVLFNMTAHF